jgi:hypothetical protein
MTYPLFLRAEFKQWLLDSKKLSPKSEDSYASYVAGANHQFTIEGVSMCKLIEKHYKLGNFYLIDETISNILDQLYLPDIYKITGKAKKTIDNWRCGLLTYKEFFYDTTDVVDGVNEIRDVLEADLNMDIICSDVKPQRVELVKTTKKTGTKNYIYSAKELMANFRFRMITQDRFYGDIFFPVSYIKTLLYRNGQKIYFDKWVSDQINGIDILCANEINKFKDISELKLEVSKESSEVSITVNNQKKTVYTSNAYGTEQHPLLSIGLRRIAIDHINPMKKILQDNIKNLPQLVFLTGQLKEIARNNATPKEYKAAGTILLNQISAKNIDINLLKVELDLIKSYTKLQLMDKFENLKKRAN